MARSLSHVRTAAGQPGRGAAPAPRSRPDATSDPARDAMRDRAGEGDRDSDRATLDGRDVYLFREGTHRRLYRVLGARPVQRTEGSGTRFAVWAPSAESVSVIGDFNGWRPGADPLEARSDGSGIWEGWVAGVAAGALYKYRIESPARGFSADRGDPFARQWESHPGTASSVGEDDRFDWTDSDWMATRARLQAPDAPLSIYEVHLGSWRRTAVAGEPGRFLGYREAAHALADHCSNLGFTHVLLLPVMEHPQDESLGYGISGYFAPTVRHGSPEGLRYLVDLLHGRGLGVLLDWMPSHFAAAPGGLARFDGTPLFEGTRARVLGSEAGSVLPFDLKRREVRAFLLSAACFWLDRFHADGLRLAGPESRRTFGRTADPAGEVEGSLDTFLPELVAAIRAEYPDTLCILGDGWSRPPRAEGPGGLLRWDGGWARETLERFAAGLTIGDPADAETAAEEGDGADGRGPDHPRLLPLSHEETPPGDGSLLGRMPGDDWQQRARLRLLLGWQHVCPGKKLLFMGGEIAQFQGWNPEHSLDWHLLEQAPHRGIGTWVRDLNRLYRAIPELPRVSFMGLAQGGDGVAAILRQGEVRDDLLLAVFNLSTAPARDCRIGVPKGGWWEEVLNSDAWMYGGSGLGNLGGVDADPVPAGEQYSSLLLSLPPLGVVFLGYRGRAPAPPR